MNPAIVPHLRRAEEMHVCVTNRLLQKQTGDERCELFSRFLSIVISHHESILILLLHKPQLAGSALVLLRSLVETACRGQFAAFLANDEQVQEIKDDEIKYPHFNEMAERLDKHFDQNALFSRFAGETWTALCGFTHSGLEQLSRRKRPDGAIGAAYEDELIIQLINHSTAALVLTAIPYLQLVKLEEDAKAVSDYYVTLHRKE
jgi:hypothetical protein